MTQKDTENLLVKLLNKQFELGGHSVRYEDVRDQERFYLKYSISEEKHKEWLIWAVGEARKIYKTKKIATGYVKFLDFMCGLTIRHDK